MGCHGVSFPSDAWTFPGTRHDTHGDDGQPLGDGQHWVPTAEAGRPAMMREESQGKAKELVRFLAMIARQ